MNMGSKSPLPDVDVQIRFRSSLFFEANSSSEMMPR